MASMIDEILAQIPAEDLAARLGTDPETAVDAARKALPALLGGLSSNVTAGGGDALGNAVLRDHKGDLLDDPNFLQSIDTDDGEKILSHIFGDQQNQVVEKLGATSRAGSSIFSKLLPMLAPLVMAWLGKKLLGGLFSGGASQATGALAGSQEAAGSSGGLGGLLGGLGGLFGGGGQSAPAANQGLPTTESSSGGGLGGLLGGLGGLFGGGGESAPSQSQSLPTQGSAGMGDLGGLGGLLGGLLGREVQEGRSSMPDLSDLFDVLGGGASDQESGPQA